MSLENLLKTKQLQPHNPTREAVQRLLQAAARNIADARVEMISGENRFDAAYKAIMQCAMVALWANRYRTRMAMVKQLAYVREWSEQFVKQYRFFNRIASAVPIAALIERKTSVVSCIEWRIVNEYR
ncbi:MAG: hypothetical protein WA435_03835 [Gallionellaceae bacterium]